MLQCVARGCSEVGMTIFCLYCFTITSLTTVCVQLYSNKAFLHYQNLGELHVTISEFPGVDPWFLGAGIVAVECPTILFFLNSY